jgi:hypothetical protein
MVKEPRSVFDSMFSDDFIERVDHTRSISVTPSDVFKAFDEGLGFVKLDFMETIDYRANSLLPPDDISKVLHMMSAKVDTSENQPRVNSFISKLIQKAYDNGYNNFNFDLRAIVDCDNFAYHLCGKQNRPLELNVIGNSGKGFAKYTNHCLITAMGDIGSYSLACAKDVTLYLKGNVGAYFGFHSPKNFTAVIKGDVKRRFAYNAKQMNAFIDGNMKQVSVLENSTKVYVSESVNQRTPIDVILGEKAKSHPEYIAAMAEWHKRFGE